MQRPDFRKPETERRDERRRESLSDWEAVLGLNDAKVELAHLDEKLRSVMTAYAAAVDAETRGKLCAVSDQISLDGKPSASHLMNEKQLAELLHSQESAKRRVEQSTNQLMRLGITTL